MPSETRRRFLVTAGTQASLAAKQATSMMPIAIHTIEETRR